MELWDVYDKFRMKTGEIVERAKDSLKTEQYHMVVHACIFNTKGELLIQHRIPTKDGFPNMWDITVGGSALSGEKSSEAVRRELFEEIGYDYDFSKMRPQITINFERGFNDIYLIEDDLNINDLVLEPTEVDEVRWASLDEILAMIDRGTFINYHKSYIMLLFESRYTYGMIKY